MNALLKMVPRLVLGTFYVFRPMASRYRYKKVVKCPECDQPAEILVDASPSPTSVHSARYAPGSDQDRCRRLLDELKDVPDERLHSQFRCVIAICDPATDKVRTCEGIYRGRIIRELRGSGGFGYDPIFYNQELGKTNAEMSVEEKNSVSHRGIALRKAREILDKDYF